MGNEQNKADTKKTNGKRSKKHRERPGFKLMEETQEKKPEPEEQEKIGGQSEDTGEQHRTSEDGGAADKGEGEEQPDDTGGQHQDRTSEDGGAANKGEGDLIKLNQKKKKKKKGVGSDPVQPQVSVAPVVQVVPRSVEEFVGLNVGGVVYMTSRSTLFRYPDSLLGILFTASVPTPKDGQGNYMIDGDGQMFRHVLNYLRRGALCLPNDFQEHRLLQQEAAFYQLPELQVLISQDLRSKTASTPSGVLVETPIKVEPTIKETCKYVIEIFVSEEDNAPQSWRIYGGLNFLENIPTLSAYIDQYRKGSQCLQFTTQHPMFPSNIHRRFPKTTLFYHIFNLGFKLHTSECMEIVDETSTEIPWLRYLFTSTTL
eukprot:XP_011681601.1 PREDICTED: uncharacterized protein LOC576837 isoform X2 [Strongylocentrotus purpuratus]